MSNTQKTTSNARKETYLVFPLSDDERDGSSEIWRPVPNSRFFSRNGEGLYQRLTDRLFLRVDEVDEAEAREVCKRFAEAFKDAEVTAAHREVDMDRVARIWAAIDEIDRPVDTTEGWSEVEAEATKLLDSIERRLVVEETLTQQLLERYGLVA